MFAVSVFPRALKLSYQSLKATLILLKMYQFGTWIILS